MEINLNLGLVTAQFEESNIELDADFNVGGVLTLSGFVDNEWVAAFDESGPADAPWKLDRMRTLSASARSPSGSSRAMSARSGTRSTRRTRRSRSSVTGAPWPSTSMRRSGREPIGRRIEALSTVFGRRLSAIDLSSERAA